MAFNLQAIVNAVTYELNDGSPFRMEALRGGGIVSARRLSERGPLQHGDTDLGVRLQPRTITLSLNFSAASATALDTARDELNTIFKPVGETAVNYPVQLRVTRDDGGVRQLDCYQTGPADIPLIPINRPGNLHRAVIQLRASDPLWYDPTVVENILTSATFAHWPLGYETIGSANVKAWVETPGTAQPISTEFTIADDDSYSIAFRTSKTGTDLFDVVFRMTSESGDGHFFKILNEGEGSNALAFNIGTTDHTHGFQWGAAMPTTDIYTFILTVDATRNYKLYRDAVLISPTYTEAVHKGPYVVEGGTAGTSTIWRADIDDAGGFTRPWDAAVPKAAIYNIELNSQQRTSLTAAIAAGTSTPSGTINYSGNWLEYPVLRINGPLSDPIVTNTLTGEVLDFTSVTLGSADYYDIDTRYGFKTVTDNGGTSQIAKLTDASDLGSFHIAAPPYAGSGVNVLTLSGTAPGTAASLVTTYYNRYTSF